MNLTKATKGRVVIFGGSGFLGINLAKKLTQENYTVTIVSRNSPKEEGSWRFIAWDIKSLGDWVWELDGAAALLLNTDSELALYDRYIVSDR